MLGLDGCRSARFVRRAPLAVMRIAINALSSTVGSGPTFFRHFLPAIAAHVEHEYCVFVSCHQDELLALVPETVETYVVKGIPRGFGARVAWEQAVLPCIFRRKRMDVLYSTGNVTTLAANIPRVVVMTTANPFSSLPMDWSLTRKVKLRVLRIASHISAHRAERTIFISRNSQRLLSARLAIPDSKAVVVPYGWAPFTLGKPCPRQKPYLLTVSVLLPYKNIERLLWAFDTLVDRTAFEGQLIIAGPVASGDYLRKLLAVRAGLTHGRRVEFTGALGQSELEALYEHALGFVFPSLEETLGIPLQEAMGAGLPIAASDTGASADRDRYFNPCREVCEGAAIYFHPLHIEEITQALERLVSDPPLRQRLGRIGRERVRRFSWERTAEETLAVLEEAASRS